ncbi:MAG TPA: MoaD/ThiS family protein [Thermoanaerobacterales bacterium]|nr:MoaD/ThiS family protein [Thermoanaerobacterales bacterium]
MISVKVKAIMDIADLFGCNEQVVSLPEGSKLSDLLDALGRKYGQAFAEILSKIYKNEKEKHNRDLHLFLNGRNIVFLEGLETKLNDGDELFFLSPVGGG